MKKLLLTLLITLSCLFSDVINWKPEYKGWLSIHRPSYFLVHPSLTKIQISAKYRLIQQLYGGYTSVMFWDWFGESAPFVEISHNPELFYELKFLPGYIIDSLD